MIDSILKLIAPHPCCGCGKSGSILCDSCTYDIDSEPFGRCIWCLSPASENEQCHPCSKKLGVRAAWAVGPRQEVLKALINGYKYESAREAGPILGSLLDRKLAVLSEDTVITAVPTAASRVRERGFDHAALLARSFASCRDMPYSPLFLRRLNTAQHTLSRPERLAHARKSFGLKHDVVPRKVLVVDDILTTGATLEACVRLLQEAGAEEIYVAIVARQLFSDMA